MRQFYGFSAPAIGFLGDLSNFQMENHPQWDGARAEFLFYGDALWSLVVDKFTT